ncbi:hypothetical protein CLV57_3277 [Mucilaginibacter auburnensis]|uniref:Uncharacterized protein n=2 Tax=Mucilaginibacter auburnensis TaxID=1457233 RepID=A0A2H9VP89_9SPHI|nr:hypothetical protein CLV57_3277 [Mucilaginibacter auburnensis]
MLSMYKPLVLPNYSVMKADEKKTDQLMREEGVEQPQKEKPGELKTDFPMSEKDEVKKAEQNTNQKQKDK